MKQTVDELVEENDRLWPDGWIFHRCPKAIDDNGNPKPVSHSSDFHK